VSVYGDTHYDLSMIVVQACNLLEQRGHIDL
jgi:hypothetical protein